MHYFINELEQILTSLRGWNLGNYFESMRTVKEIALEKSII